MNAVVVGSRNKRRLPHCLGSALFWLPLVLCAHESGAVLQAADAPRSNNASDLTWSTLLSDNDLEPGMEFAMSVSYNLEGRFLPSSSPRAMMRSA